MKSRVASLLLASAFISAPVFAQGPPGGGPPGGTGGAGIQALASDLAALTARVSKLEGNIVATDLAGTYSIVGLDTTMSGAHPGIPATINTLGFRSTLTLNSDGTTGHAAATECEGSTLVQGSWSMHGVDCSEPETDVTWTYANGVITITFLSDGDQIPFVVGLGGRLLAMAYAPFHPSDPSSDQLLIIAIRLK